ncbi:restriction endonuclease [Streptomyces kasugaensis]|uniref:Restriction endonuclease n=1 Tax=Streptomyces kasugaensis TaxID=1946 RepID=A0A4Q9HUU7_STRKA|nr:restriction endonuclease [Streptomyces kasugaensis]TBO58896.1 restriction endonuclease [Streptomyces kasugaensis]
MSHPTILYDPEGLIDAELPLDREPHMSLVKAVLTLTSPESPGDALRPRDYAQIALQLTGHARAIAAEVRRHSAVLPPDSDALVLTEMVLAEADRRLSTPSQDTLHCAQNRARLVRALPVPSP